MMQKINVPYPKMAEMALTMVACANVPANDEALAMATGVRSFLRAIANGELSVMAPQQEPEGPTPAGSLTDRLKSREAKRND